MFLFVKREGLNPDQRGATTPSNLQSLLHKTVTAFSLVSQERFCLRTVTAMMMKNNQTLG